jgi:hypothetical protein
MLPKKLLVYVGGETHRQKPVIGSENPQYLPLIPPVSLLFAPSP